MTAKLMFSVLLLVIAGFVLARQGERSSNSCSFAVHGEKSHLHFRNSNRRPNSSLSPTGPSHLERAVCALAIDDLPVQHYKGKYYRNVPVRCEKWEEYSRSANRSLVQFELIP
jgi:hypothetical protein